MARTVFCFFVNIPRVSLQSTEHELCFSDVSFIGFYDLVHFVIVLIKVQPVLKTKKGIETGPL